MLIAFVVALGMNLFSFWKSDTMVLRMYGAEEVTAQSAPEYYGLVQELAQRAELPMPRVYVMHNPQPNAFATGRSPANSAVCASTGLLEMLSREEVAGVMAHELAHIKNRDTLTMTVAATIGGAISMLAQWLQFSTLFGGNREGGSRIGAFAAMLLAPFAAMLVQMAVSRSREYQADHMGALIAGNPLWLASALQKIQAYAHQIPNEQAEAAPATAHIVHHQSPDRARYGQSVLDPSKYREPHRRAREAGGRDGRSAASREAFSSRARLPPAGSAVAETPRG